MAKKYGRGDNRRYDDEEESPKRFKLDRSAKDVLASKIKAIEKLAEEAKAIREEAAEVMRELKALGYDTKAIRALIKERADRRKDEDAYEDFIAVLDLYRGIFG